MIRIKIDETSPILPRYEVPGTVQELLTQKFNTEIDSKSGIITLSLEDAPNTKVRVTCQPLRIDVFDNNEPVISLNSKSLLNIEHLRTKPQPKQEEEAEEAVDEDAAEAEDEVEKEEKEAEEEKSEEEEGMWEESFKSHRDSKPRGPESIGLDTSFINFSHVYGIPEHADSLALKSTVGSEPYRLYNLDVFEYDLDMR